MFDQWEGGCGQGVSAWWESKGEVVSGGGNKVVVQRWEEGGTMKEMPLVKERKKRSWCRLEEELHVASEMKRGGPLSSTTVVAIAIAVSCCSHCQPLISLSLSLFNEFKTPSP